MAGNSVFPPLSPAFVTSLQLCRALKPFHKGVPQTQGVLRPARFGDPRTVRVLPARVQSSSHDAFGWPPCSSPSAMRTHVHGRRLTPQRPRGHASRFGRPRPAPGRAPAGDRRPRRRKAPRSVPSQVALSPNVLPAPHFAVRGPLPLGSLRRLRSPVPSLPLSLAWKQRKVAVARADVLREGPAAPHRQAS